jgi:ubiquinone/menaquinone biosynthesis C-methylase UbiE|tara:strand:- start:4289 stop:5092 length:804 start_codon:yes stop_codon:yes gene_type:complete
MSDDVYVHGHHESVLRSHTWRTIENSAKYLEQHLEDRSSLLDIGCGPGTITIDFAKRLKKGTVLGIDISDEIIKKARIASQEFGFDNCSFNTGDTYHLDFEDNTFDIVHAHQLLQHLTDPVAAIKEMRRVVRPGGVVALRDADYGGMIWAPTDPKLDEWMDLYQQMTKKNKVTANAGRYLFSWVTQASFSSVEVTSSTWTFSTPVTRQWWGGLWAERIQKSTFSEQVLEHELGTQDLLDGLSEAFRRWAEQSDGFFLVPHCEIIAIK